MATETVKKDDNVHELTDQMSASFVQLILSNPTGKAMVSSWLDGAGISMDDNQIKLTGDFSIEVIPNKKSKK